jgi:hypothetical protein
MPANSSYVTRVKIVAFGPTRGKFVGTNGSVDDYPLFRDRCRGTPGSGRLEFICAAW